MAIFKRTTKKKEEKPIVVIEQAEKTMSIPTNIHLIRQPHVSEKAYRLVTHRQYTFVVDDRATKPQIAHAVARRYNVSVTSVHMVRLPGKPKFFKNRSYGTAPRKKAIVTIQEGQTIEMAQ